MSNDEGSVHARSVLQIKLALSDASPTLAEVQNSCPAVGIGGILGDEEDEVGYISIINLRRGVLGRDEGEGEEGEGGEECAVSGQA